METMKKKIESKAPLIWQIFGCNTRFGVMPTP